MADPNFNLFQQIYCLSMVTSLVSKLQDTEANLQNALIKALEVALPTLTGKWTISWGPRVFKEKNADTAQGGPDNVWMGVIDEEQQVCVISIAGTAGNSWADLYQDLNVAQVVDFNDWVNQWTSDGIPEPRNSIPCGGQGSTTAYCARGACSGVWNIVNNPSTAASAGMRLDQYLNGLDQNYTVVVTGHSLGGVLSPMVALGLSKSKLARSHLMRVVPSAGVSPGNGQLAAEYAAAFPKYPESGSNYMVYNLDFFNTADIVPQAWSTNPNHDRNLNRILGTMLRFSDDQMASTAEFFLTLAKLLSESKIEYVPIPGQSFNGVEKPPVVINSQAELQLYVSEQHVWKYWDQIGIRSWIVPFDKTLRCKLPSRGKN